MSVGTYISTIGHVGLLAWLFLGWGFAAEPLPFDFSEVEVISAEDFAALTTGTAPREPQTETETPQTPVIEPETPDLPEQESPVAPDVPEAVEAPDIEPSPAPEEAPEPPVEQELSAPAEPITSDTVPPQTELAPPANTTLGTDARPVQRPAEILSSEVNQPPPEDVEISAITEDAVAESDAPEVTQQEAQDQTAEAATTDRTITEADDPADAPVLSEQAALAPTTSVRPPVRPDRPEPAAQTAEVSEPAVPDTAASVDDLLSNLVEEPQPASDTAAPTGPPLTQGERDGLRLAIKECWSLPISTDAQRTTVVVEFELSQAGDPSGIAMVSADGPTQEANRAAFEAARRAILRCARSGYQLPAEKYEQWRNVEVTFNPEQMRQR